MPTCQQEQVYKHEEQSETKETQDLDPKFTTQKEATSPLRSPQRATSPNRPQCQTRAHGIVHTA